jgi:uncharacterized protein
MVVEYHAHMIDDALIDDASIDDASIEYGRGIRIGTSVLGGRGVFATRAFRRSDIVEVCPVLFVNAVPSDLDDYVFSHPTDPTLTVIAFGLGSMYNHASKPNVGHTTSVESRTMTFSALRTIRPGEEITISYGKGWWSARGLTPVRQATPSRRTRPFLHLFASGKKKRVPVLNGRKEETRDDEARHECAEEDGGRVSGNSRGCEGRNHP